MGRIKSIQVSNYRSVCERIEVNFPQNSPLVLLGENNSGKSNIVRALDLVLGEFWPGNHDPDDHEFFGRERGGEPIEIEIKLDGVKNYRSSPPHTVESLTWRFPAGDDGGFFMTDRIGRPNRYVSNAVREQCLCIVVGADRRLSYQLSYASRYTLLSKVMKRFHQELISDQDRVEQLRSHFTSVKSIFDSVDRYTEFTHVLQQQVDELSGNLSYGLGIDFSAYDPSNFFHALKVLPVEGDEPRSFGELGTGQEQLLALGLAYAYARAFRDTGGLILVIEEPEAHLHPYAQRWVAQKTREISEQGVQVVVTTHSPAFVDIMNVEGLVRVHKPHNSTCVTQLSRGEFSEYCRSTGATRASGETILPYYAAGATEEILSGLFSRKVVLVEGPTEALAVPVYLSRLGHHPNKEGTAVIPVGGVGSLAKWWRLFSAFGLPCYIIFDNDGGDDRQGLKRTDMLETLDLATDRVDTLLREQGLYIDESFAIFGVDFESTMRKLFDGDYEMLEQQASEQFGLGSKESKPLVARYVAERLPLDEHPVGAEKLQRLSNFIFHLGTSTEPEHVWGDDEDDWDLDDVPFD